MKKTISRRKAIERLSLALGAMSFPVSSWATTADQTPILLPEKRFGKAFEKPVSAITLGAGNRGNVYGNYAVEYPDQLNIVGVAEPIEVRRKDYMAKHKIEDSAAFYTWENVFERPKFADAIIITTPDDLHYAPCMKALETGYDVLLEKPIAPTEQECRDILALARQTKRIVAVCHVLRYAPYFIKLKEMIKSGILGSVQSIQHFEPINHIHMSHSYVRGNWHHSKSTTPIILAKSCHDLDIIKWMLGKSCTHIQAFGSLGWFRSENAPEGSTARCTDGCAVEGQCPYSALKIYYHDRTYLHHFDLPKETFRRGEVIMDYLRQSNYGRCVYRMDNDQPDHYVTSMLFEGGVTASFSMEAFTSYHGRRTRIMGSMGDVVGDMTNFTWTDFRTGEKQEWSHASDGHGGGDWRLVADWLQAVAQQDARLLSSTIDASIESHIMGFEAEKSRLEKRVAKVKV